MKENNLFVAPTVAFPRTCRSSQNRLPGGRLVRLGHVARFAQVPALPPSGVGERQRVSGGFEKGRSLIQRAAPTSVGIQAKLRMR